MVRDLLAEADADLRSLDAVAFGRGPGSFTGVRIATGVAQGLGFAADLPLVAVSSLRALAQGVARTADVPRVLSAFDARMDEVYWGAFARQSGGLMELLGEERVCTPSTVPRPGGPGQWLGAGEGWAVHDVALRARMGPQLSGVVADCYPSALDVLALGADALSQGLACAAVEARPVYLRDQVTRTQAQPNQ